MAEARNKVNLKHVAEQQIMNRSLMLSEIRLHFLSLEQVLIRSVCEGKL